MIKAILAMSVALAMIGSATAGPLERQKMSQEYKRAEGIRDNLNSRCQRYAYDSPGRAQCEASILQVEDYMGRLRQRFDEDKRREPPQQFDPEDSKYLTPNDALMARHQEAVEGAQRGAEDVFRAILGVPREQTAETIPHTSSDFAAFVAQRCPKYWGSLPQSERTRVLTAYPGTSEDVKRATVKRCVDLEGALPK